MRKFTPIGWYEEQQRKRKQASEDFETSNLNRQAQTFLKSMNGKFDIVNEESEALHRINRELTQSSVLNLQYANNFNSKRVLAAQVEFMNYLMNKYPELEDGRTRDFIQRTCYRLGYDFAREREYFINMLR